MLDKPVDLEAQLNKVIITLTKLLACDHMQGIQETIQDSLLQVKDIQFDTLQLIDDLHSHQSMLHMSMERQNKILREALEFYGDKDNWACSLKHVLEDGFLETKSDGDGYYQDPSEMNVLKDKVYYHKAQQALSQCDKLDSEGK